MGFMTRKKKLRKKSPTKICATVKTVSITVSLTSSCPNIVSQHNLRICSFSFKVFMYLFSASGQLSKIDTMAKDASSPGDDNELKEDLTTNRLQIFFVHARSSRGIRPKSNKKFHCNRTFFYWTRFRYMTLLSFIVLHYQFG